MSQQHTEAEMVEHHIHHAIEERESGFWIYLLSDALIFSLLFATYGVMVERVAHGPITTHFYDLKHVFMETMTLLASSVTFGFAAIGVEKRSKAMTMFWLVVTFVLGAYFVYLELVEFQAMIHEGAAPWVSGSLSSFYTLVSTHGLHVSAGLLWILIMAVQVMTKGFQPIIVSRIFRLGLFWHFLDVVWIGIFTFVYLAGRL